VRQLRCYVAEHQTERDSHLSLLRTAYSTQMHASSGEIPFTFVSPRWLPLIVTERTKSAGSPKGPSQPHTGLVTKNRRPHHCEAGGEAADVEAPQAKPPLEAEPKSRPRAGVTIQPRQSSCPPRRYRTPPSKDGGASQLFRDVTAERRSVLQGGRTQSQEARYAAAPRCGPTL